MSIFIRRCPAVRRDLVEIFVRLSRQGSVKTARRFLSEVDKSFDRIANRPGIGARFEPGESNLEQLRVATVSRFKHYLVFYRPIDDGIEVLRVLHGARDIQNILADDDDSL